MKKKLIGLMTACALICLPLAAASAQQETVIIRPKEIHDVLGCSRKNHRNI